LDSQLERNRHYLSIGLSWLLGQDRRGGEAESAAEPGNRRSRRADGGGAGAQESSVAERSDLARAEVEHCTEEEGPAVAEAARQQLGCSLKGRGGEGRRDVGERGPGGRHAGARPAATSSDTGSVDWVERCHEVFARSIPRQSPRCSSAVLTSSWASHVS
jgi:hypothetical protein